MSYTVFVAKLTKLRTLELGAVVCDEKLRHSFVGEERAKQVDGGFRRDMPGWKYFRPFAVSIDDDEINIAASYGFHPLHTWMTLVKLIQASFPVRCGDHQSVPEHNAILDD